MKIQKIRFENIHSLRGKHEIDFSSGALAEAGLFAITGPTGSGKSTILDVITLALYNKIARISSNISNTNIEDDGGIMTRNTQSCFAEVEYTCNGKTYRSHWSIARNRNNNLNPRQQELVAVSTGEILETGTKTPDKNEEIIGLSYDQFVKAIVIAQGEFSKLLQASRNERSKLLEDITGAPHYRQIGIKVYERQWQLKNEIDLKEANLQGIQILDEAIVSEKKDELRLLIEQKPEKVKAADSARKKVEIRKELLKQLEEKNKLNQAIEKLKQDIEIYKPYKIQLQTHERLVKHIGRVQEYDRLNAGLSELIVVKEKLHKRILGVKNEREEHLKKGSRLINIQLTIDSATEKLEEFRKNIDDLVAIESLKENEALFLKNQVESTLPKIHQKGYSLPPLTDTEHFESEFEKLKENISKIVLGSGIPNLQELEKKIEILREKQESAIAFISKKESLNKTMADLEKIRTAIKTNTDKISSNKSELEKSKIQSKKLEDEISELEKIVAHQRLHQSMDEQRKNLMDNEPCPLCGSLHHPYSSGEIVTDVKEELVTEKKSALQVLSRLITSLETENNLLLKENNRSEGNLEQLQNDLEKTTNELLALNLVLKWNVEDTIQNLHEKQNQFAEENTHINSLKQAFEIQNILSEISNDFKKWRNSLREFREISEKRKKLYSGNDINRDISFLINHINQTSTQLDGLLTQLSDNKENAKELTKKFEIEKNSISLILSEVNLNTIDDLRKGIMLEERAQKIRNQGNKLQQDETRLTERTNLLSDKITQLKQEDDNNLSMEVLMNQAAKTSEEVEKTNLAIGRLTQELEQDENARKRQHQVLVLLEKLKKDFSLWKKMSDLIGSRSGDKFSRFVQDLTLKQLISFTNSRLADFSDRYFLDPESVDDNSDLYIIDKYMGNSKRSIRTLSGGETFLVSLAMAFALSDIAARNIKIESLFIDEGFGTLDPDTLDQAITVLEKMQNESNKSIGIISHVEELKKRITTQIQLEKGSLGYSELKVIQ